MLEEVKVYVDCLNKDGVGDLVRCSDCYDDIENYMVELIV